MTVEPPCVRRVNGLPNDFRELLAASLAEGFGALARMQNDWNSGSNRFDQSGELLLEACSRSRLIGICGLNCDPFSDSSVVGRLRHLYVLPDFRRRGVGYYLVAEALAGARRAFVSVRLRTFDDGAARFYGSVGFHQLSGVNSATHEIQLFS